MADPEETQGPYPADGSNSSSGVIRNVLSTSGVVRSDIRPSFAGVSSNVAAGVQTTLTLTLVNTNNACAPLAGYAIYLWHCTREGLYSLYTVPAENYLRGVGVTDSNGQVTFITIFPGCYDGRWPHMHFEVYPSLPVATSYTNKILTSQLAMPLATCNAIYPNATGYSSSVTNLAKVTLATDNVFGDNTAAQIAAMQPVFTGSVSAGYTGTVTVGIAR